MIRVNDKWDVRWMPGMSVQDILKACAFTHHHIVVSIDGVLVPPAEYETQTLPDGAAMQVVHVIGGG